ncbi:Beta-galactosidase [Hypsibius exemplaris]|uniref:Beta-galactosidase n=1 Tax=Hypsibius exemplaris TaxID=2072580 RepID=A0A1W0WEC5_HYPEX|nr:Beta-galactosidase [Hypsibius exemplaris]
MRLHLPPILLLPNRRLVYSAMLLFSLAVFYKIFIGTTADELSTVVRPATATQDFKQAETASSNRRSFTVKDGDFLKDGEPFSFHAGMAHYWRRPPQYWEDTMIKLKALGLNTLQTYISWNLHEPEPESYDFEGALDFAEYFRLAQKHRLLVIARPGPFINAEVDQGGFPYWLKRLNPEMKLRTHDPAYFQYVTRWYEKLLPIMKPFLYANGGPIILVQIENEYGSYHACDQQYLLDLRDLTRKLLGPDIVLYTTDGPNATRIACGRVPDTVTTIDFGAGADLADVTKIFRESVPVGPLVNSEFYPGWINHWGRDWNTVPFEPVVKSTEELLRINASFTYYPLVGGTNFGFTVGANVYKGQFLPGTTSYDFDAPVSEAGDLTEKYWKLREVFKKAGLVPEGDPPLIASPKGKYGTVHLKHAGSVFANLKNLSPSDLVRSENPVSFENLNQPYGFVLYRTTVHRKFRDPAVLSIPQLRDRATIFVNQKVVGVLGRTSGLTDVNIFIRPGQVLDILVHNEGRITVGDMTDDAKGLGRIVTLQNETLTGWEHYPIRLPSYPVKDPRPLDLADTAVVTPSDWNVPSFFTGTFESRPARDVFLRMDNWAQGYAFINGYNLGRYWPAQGPQMTLFIPGVFLSSTEANVLQIFELSQAPSSAADCVVELTDEPVMEPKTVYRHRASYANTPII